MTILLFCLLAVCATALKVSRESHQRVILKLGAGFGKEAPSSQKPKAIQDDAKCPCGSGSQYSECCKSAHNFGIVTSSPSELVRARYSAYAANNADFIIGTTSDQSPDAKHYKSLPGDEARNNRRWSKDIHNSMMKDYFYIKTEIISEEIDPDQKDSATVTFRHLAIQKGSNVMYPVEEKATLSRDDGVTWKYVLGEVSRPPSEESNRMMSTWPEEMGLSLKAIEKAESDELTDEDEEMRAAAAAEEAGWIIDKDGNQQKEDPRVTAAGLAGEAAQRKAYNLGRSNPTGGAYGKTLGRKLR